MSCCFSVQIADALEMHREHVVIVNAETSLNTALVSMAEKHGQTSDKSLAKFDQVVQAELMHI